MGNSLLGPPWQHPKFKGSEWKGTSWSANLLVPPTPVFGFLGALSHPPAPGGLRSHTWSWPCCVEDANTAAPGHWLQSSPHRLPTKRSQLGGASRPPPRLDTPLQPSPPQQGPPTLTLPFSDGKHAAGCLGGPPGFKLAGARSTEIPACTCSREADPW